MSIEVAVMEPKYQVNLGHIARVSKNFGIKRLILINPRCNHKGKEAIKYSKHAKELLQNTRTCKSIDQLENCFIIGTTGIWHKTADSFYNLYDLDKVRRLTKRAASAGKNTIVLLGRDDTGLSKEELRKCDATISLSTSNEYPILNISHALAIILHALGNVKAKANVHIYADNEYQKRIFRLFERLVKSNPKIRDKRSVNMAFRHVIRRSMPTKKEINALSIALAKETIKKE